MRLRTSPSKPFMIDITNTMANTLTAMPATEKKENSETKRLPLRADK